MAYARTFDALVLHTYDVGEADRLVVLLTRERGKCIARAKGVRRLASKMSGSLLACQQISVDLVEGKTGWIVTGAQLIRAFPKERIEVCQRGVELLHVFTEDNEPLPEIFDLAVQLLESDCSALLPFTLRLLHLLGFLPHEESDERFCRLDSPEQEFVRLCSTCDDLGTLIQMCPDTHHLQQFCDVLLQEELPRPLKSRALFASPSAR